MVKHTVGSLISLLEKFPRDLPVSNEISLIWFFPDELKSARDEYTDEEYRELTQEHSTDLCIFEGSWENGTIVDQDNTMEYLIEKYDNL